MSKQQKARPLSAVLRLVQPCQNGGYLEQYYTNAAIKNMHYAELVVLGVPPLHPTSETTGVQVDLH